MKKIKKKTYIRFNAKPQPGYLLAVYGKVNEYWQNKTEQEFFDSKVPAYAAQDYDTLLSMDLLVVSTIYPEPIFLNRCVRDSYIGGFSRRTTEEDFTSFPFILPFESAYFGASQGSNDVPGLLDCFFIDKDKNFHYRYITGQGVSSLFINQTRLYSYQGGVNEYSLKVRDESFIQEVKEKKILFGEFDVTESPEILAENNFTNRSIRKNVTYRELLPGETPPTDIDTNTLLPSVSKDQRDFVTILSYHGAIFSINYDAKAWEAISNPLLPKPEEILDLFGNPIPLLGANPASGYEFKMEDSNGNQVINGIETGQYLKFASQINQAPVDMARTITATDPSTAIYKNPANKQLYLSPYLIEEHWEQRQGALKASDSESYLIHCMDESIIWRDGIEYKLPNNYFYNPQGVNLPVDNRRRRWHIESPDSELLMSDYCEYFSCRGMVSNYISVEGDREFVSNDYWIALDTTHFLTSSWWGDFIYKVRVDEFLDGAFFHEELVKAGWPIPEKNNLFSLEGRKIKKDLKIYHPSTKSLWVEKYQVILDPDANTAEIKYITKFKISFTPPLDNPLLETWETPRSVWWNVPGSTLQSTSLKGIQYIPFK